LIRANDRTRRNDRFGSNGYPGRDEYLRPYPRPIFNGNGPIPIRHFCVAKIVISRAEKRTLGNAAMGADSNALEIQYEDFLADPGEFPDTQLPGKVNIDPRLDNHALAHMGAKQAQDRAFPGGGNGARGQEH
jgi:hypothetical protein